MTFLQRTFTSLVHAHAGRTQTPNTLARDKPSLGKLKNQHYTKNSTSTENQKSSKLAQALEDISIAVRNNRRQE